jgi:translocation and assembly module TamB
VRKRPLTGTIDVQWTKGSLDLTHCELHGNGFDISIAGLLHEKIDYQVKVTDLGGLIPQAGGRFSASGWIRRTKDYWAGTTRAEGNAITIDRFKVDSAILQAQVNEKGDEIVRGRLQARNAAFGPLNLGSPGVNVEGKLTSHDLYISLVWPKSSGTIIGHGGIQEGSWQGTLSKIEGTDAHAGPFNLVKPVALNVSGKRITMTPLILAGSTGEYVEIACDLMSNPASGNFQARWERINLARANQFLKDVKIDGQTSGSLEGQIADKERLKLNWAGSGNFTMTRGAFALRVSSTTKINFDEKGMRAWIQAGLQGGGKIEGYFDSGEPAYLKRPESGNIKLSWNDLDVAIFKQWLPRAFDVKGKLSGAIQGKLLPGSFFEFSGDSRMSDSSFTWSNEGGIITSSAENASIEFYWKDRGLRGNLDVRFPSHGKVRSTFTIPIPAKFPLEIDKTGNVDIEAQGEIRERGIVSSLLPGLIEESKGQLSFELKRTGTWEKADIKGRLRLDNAAAYLPATGTRIKDGTMEAVFAQDRVEVTSFTAKSGPGKLEGTAIFWLRKLGIDRFKARLGGERFQAIYLPELQVMTSPDLTIEGEGNRFKINGSVRVPEALLREGGSKTAVRTSQDVVIVDAPQREKKPSQTDVDIQVDVIFGDKVRIQVQGLDGRMEGSVLLTGRALEKIYGKGVLRIVNGKYNSYGIKLDVTRGNIIFDGGLVDQATLDIMAIRTINPGKFDEIKTGVTVTGTPMSPLIKLYSEPPMTDTDILSYMVIGRPIKAGAESNQTAMLLKSASAVLGGTGAVGIQSQLQQRLGIDTLDVQEGPKSGFTSSRKTTTASSSPTLDSSLMTVGKYLSPDLYVSYGRSLLNDQFLVSARYNLTKQVEIESKAGVATSVDLFYKIEFD